jgi:hypothetical protein
MLGSLSAEISFRFAALGTRERFATEVVTFARHIAGSRKTHVVSPV